MLATCLIGMDKGSNLITEIVDLGDDDKSPDAIQFRKIANTSRVRECFQRDWGILNDNAIVPELSQQVLKLSRHSIIEDQIWTWLGLYEGAYPSGRNRDSCYFGAGVLVLNGYVEWAVALNFLRDVLADWKAVSMIDGRLREGFPKPFPWPQSKGLVEAKCSNNHSGGMRFNMDDFHYVVVPDDGDKTLLAYLNAAQISTTFSQSGRIFLSKSVALKEKVKVTNHFRIFERKREADDSVDEKQSTTPYREPQRAPLIGDAPVLGRDSDRLAYSNSQLLRADELSSESQPNVNPSILASSSQDNERLKCELQIKSVQDIASSVIRMEKTLDSAAKNLQLSANQFYLNFLLSLIIPVSIFFVLMIFCIRQSIHIYSLQDKISDLKSENLKIEKLIEVSNNEIISLKKSLINSNAHKSK